MDRPSRESMRTSAWLPAALWMALLFVISSFPGSAYPRVEWPGADKLVHVALYLPLGAALAHALRQAFASRGAGAHVAAAVLAAGLYGVSDELHQAFVPRRSADAADVLADLVGALLGALLYRRVGKARPRNQDAALRRTGNLADRQ
jgi:VanZ family protein